MQMNNTLIIGADHDGKDVAVVTVGKLINGRIEMVNIFKGEEAVEIYQTLTTNPQPVGEVDSTMMERVSNLYEAGYTILEIADITGETTATVNILLDISLMRK